MRRRELVSSGLSLVLLSTISPPLRAQELVNDESAPLLLDRIIPIPDTVGRFDHMSIDNERGLIFAPVYGNDTVEILDIARGKRIRTLSGEFIRPQAAVYMPELNRLAVSNNGDGTVKVFDGDNFRLIGAVKFASDADNLRYDPEAKRVYCGYGEGSIGVFDATTNKIVDDYPVGVHPESFQLERNGPRIFVNLASISRIAVIDRKTRKVEKWALKEAGTNFPMAL